MSAFAKAPEKWPGLTAVHLMDEFMFPVCAPDFPLLRGSRLAPEALARCTLIHDLSMANAPDYPTWRMWLEASGHTRSRPTMA